MKPLIAICDTELGLGCRPDRCSDAADSDSAVRLGLEDKQRHGNTHCTRGKSVGSAMAIIVESDRIFVCSIDNDRP